MHESDLTDILRNWPYEPGRINARRITGRDGRQKIQLRLELGLMQMEVDSRPDGRRPEGCESLLHHQQDRLQHYARESGAAAAAFALSPDECRALREEAVQFYHRWVALFALGDFARVVRDTGHNLAIFDLCRDHAADDRDRVVLEQFRPAVAAMRVRAGAEQALAERDPKRALAALDRGLEGLRTIFADAGQEAHFDTANEVQLLRGMRDALVPKLPASQRAELRERLQAAIDAENYELAAILRDELRMLKD